VFDQTLLLQVGINDPGLANRPDIVGGDRSNAGEVIIRIIATIRTGNNRPTFAATGGGSDRTMCEDRAQEQTANTTTSKQGKRIRDTRFIRLCFLTCVHTCLVAASIRLEQALTCYVNFAGMQHIAESVRRWSDTRYVMLVAPFVGVRPLLHHQGK
jgi:hypothetical protein